MEFCPVCGTLMRVEKGKLKCPNCGYEKPLSESNRKIVLKTRIQHSPREKTIVIEEDKKILNPIVRDVRCPKCGHNEAEYWIIQTRRADEPPTRFYRCLKCGHVWREYE
ncbi:MAG: transcription factor S [Desulfurococcales archaeon]|nr:transcription factor S [Desulfurococcales archaeon]MCC6062760.1 transcription factor S [Desulfurococcales archaeon]NAZ14040.1 transcription factor S [Desulfurococcales archaeon]